MEKLNELLQKLGIEKELPKLDENFKLSELMPKLDDFWEKAETLIRIFVMVGPLLLLGLGLWYFFAPPKEANRRAGFRTPWGMGSVEAWRFTQRAAGILFCAAGFGLTVAMAAACRGFAAMETVDALQAAGKCILWQVGISLAVCVVSHLTPPVFYTWKGDRRFKKHNPEQT